MKRKIVVGFIILCVFALIAVLPRIMVAPAVNQSLADYIQNEFSAAQLSITIDAPWGWELILGQIEQLELELTDGVISGLPVASMSLVGQDVRFNSWALFREKQFAYSGAEFLQIEARVSEEAINEYFRREVEAARDLEITITDQNLRLSGVLDVWNIPWNINIDGGVEIVDRSKLRFVPLSLAVEQAKVPPFLMDIAKDHFGVAVDFDVLPFPVEITDVQMEEGFIRVRVQAAE